MGEGRGNKKETRQKEQTVDAVRERVTQARCQAVDRNAWRLWSMMKTVMANMQLGRLKPRIFFTCFSSIALICSAAEVLGATRSYTELRYRHAQVLWLPSWKRSEINRVAKKTSGSRAIA